MTPEIEAGAGKICLATVLDAFSRRCLGYAMGEHHDAALVGASLKMATATRGGRRNGTIFHRCDPTQARPAKTVRAGARVTAMMPGWTPPPPPPPPSTWTPGRAGSTSHTTGAGCRARTR
ncbi:DDE-type integrase/transposase/recombinase [Streptomyces sp. NPDC057689]|uniref:DDE-type integrase/transposase/recombinase n=1 Tax=Streptomyces sp. NPDC057689 TaxID=3346213 RepID=UPI0036CA015E